MSKSTFYTRRKDAEMTSLDALAWGLRDAGVGLVTGYPGFHAHELLTRCGGIPSVNERTAYAVAWGGAVAGMRSAVAFKNVGLNDAADPFRNSMLLGTNAGLVVLVFDDVEVEGSQCRQDSRPYFDLCPGLWLEPMSASHAYRCARIAPGLAERFSVPVVLRITNPLLRSRGPVIRQPVSILRRAFQRDPARAVAHPINARAQSETVSRRQCTLAAHIEGLYRHARPRLASRAIIRVGAVHRLPGTFPIWTYPLPEDGLQRWLYDGDTQAVEVHELGSSFVLEKVRALACRMQTSSVDPSQGIDHSARFVVSANFDALYQALRSFPGRIVCGDLGSFTMDPARTVDACLCYGAGVAVAIGCSLGAHERPVFCVTGDAGFLHSGQASLEEGQKRGASFVTVVLDNGGARSTGGQSVPATIRVPHGIPVLPIDHAMSTPEGYRLALGKLAGHPGPTVLHVKC